MAFAPTELALGQACRRTNVVRVGLVSPYDLGRPGGVQQQVLELCRLLDQREIEVTLVGPGAGPHGGVDVGRVWPVRANGSVVPIAVGFGISRRLRTALSGVDVVHVNEPLMPAVGLAALWLNHPLVATFHARPPDWVLRGRRFIPKSWFRKAVLTAVSTEAAHLASALGDVEIVPPGIHCAAYQMNAPRMAERIVFLGRNEPRKGLPVLLKAWPQVRARHPEAELIVIGSTGEDDNPQGVRYAGRVSEEEKRRFLASAAVMAAPNLGGESFGIVVLEAMASGCAIVASDIPAFRNLTAGTAVLFPAGNDKALAVAVSDLLDDRAETERRSSAGRARAVDFDWSRVLPAYQKCYEVAASRAGRGVG